MLKSCGIRRAVFAILKGVEPRIRAAFAATDVSWRLDNVNHIGRQLPVRHS